MGTVFGYCSGYASKQIGKAIALMIGTGFMAVKAAAYSGYLDVKWNKVQEDVTKLVDADGDGKLTQKDVLVYWKKIKHGELLASLLASPLPLPPSPPSKMSNTTLAQL